VKLPDPPLLLLTDRKQTRRPLEEVLAQACAGGCRWISIREKDLPRPDQIALAEALHPIAQRAGARLILHGDAELAHKAGLKGVHLASGSDFRAARRLLGPDALIGLSIHSVAEAADLDPAALDYTMAGPIFVTASKPGYGPPLGPNGVAAIAQTSSVPVIGVGGISADNVAAVMRAGIAGIAVMGSVMRARDPAAEMERLVKALAAGNAFQIQPRS
jgi:thiamine-phosphate pyrophosphorylase